VHYDNEDQNEPCLRLRVVVAVVVGGEDGRMKEREKRKRVITKREAKKRVEVKREHFLLEIEEERVLETDTSSS
jgi:hypothetical protein